MALSAGQRGVLSGIVPALAVSLAVLAGAILWAPAWLLPAGDGPGARLAFAAGVDAAIAIVLAVAIGALARHRFFTPADIDGGGLAPGTKRAAVLQAILQNTLEQAVLAVLAHLAWAALMPRPWLAAIPAATALFVLGRGLFARGYGGGAAARALGFGLTFYPTLLMLAGLVVALVAGY